MCGSASLLVTRRGISSAARTDNLDLLVTATGGGSSFLSLERRVQSESPQIDLSASRGPNQKTCLRGADRLPLLHRREPRGVGFAFFRRRQQTIRDGFDPRFL